MDDYSFWTQPRSFGEVLKRQPHDEAEAVKEALASVRRLYLGAYERLLADADADDIMSQAMIQGQIDTLRRQLGLRKEPDRERIRAQTRERVRRHRERQRQPR